MPSMAAFDDVKVHRRKRDVPGGISWRTDFLSSKAIAGKIAPQAYLIERDAGKAIPPHFHTVDQFQVVVDGGGRIGRHKIAVNGVHFARAHTPYGPIVPGEQGIKFLTLRAMPDPNAYFIPEFAEMLKSIPDREPWQISQLPDAGMIKNTPLQSYASIRDDRGLAAYAVKLGPAATLSAPDPSAGNGQYIVVNGGSLNYSGKSHDAITVVFIDPHEQPFSIIAGSQGLEALVLNFPQCAAFRERDAEVNSIKTRLSNLAPVRKL